MGLYRCPAVKLILSLFGIDVTLNRSNLFLKWKHQLIVVQVNLLNVKGLEKSFSVVKGWVF